MIRRSFLAGLGLVAFLCHSSISAQTFSLDKLQLSWENLENNHQGESHFLSAFRFQNTGQQDFPATGWTLYFNLSRVIQAGSVTGNVQIAHQNGDLFSLKPGADFKGIRAGQSIEVTFLADDWALNESDAPTGPYLVWDAAPGKGFPITQYRIVPFTRPEQYQRTKNDGTTLPTPEKLFAKYAQTMLLPLDKTPRVLPTPENMVDLPGQGFRLSTAMPIFYSKDFEKEAQYLQEALQKCLGEKLQLVPATPGSGRIGLYLQQAKGLAKEAYELNVTNTAISISASSPAGIFYGIQSLKMLLPVQCWSTPMNVIEIPGISVLDQPRFGYRGLMLDVARNFHSKQSVLKVLDLMSLYKLNTLHFHFSEDEAWRLEIPGLPELTTVGAQRGHSMDKNTMLQPSFGSGPQVGTQPGSGYYTRADFIEILTYAQQRHIQVIPEIETPGHARAAVQAMRVRAENLLSQGKTLEADEYRLQEPNDPSKYQSVQGWKDNVMCVALPSVYRFLDKVVSELALMYQAAGAPLQTIHFGGDEVPAGVWEQSPACQALLAKHPVYKTVDDLWYYYYDKVDSLAKKHGLRVSGWEEIAVRKTKLHGQSAHIPNPDFVHRGFRPYVWNNVPGWGAEDLAYRLANAGYEVVLSCVSNLYFDLAYNNDPKEPGYYWGGFLDVDKPFYFIPFEYFKNVKEDRAGNPIDPAIFTGKDGLTDFGQKNILGIQGHLWSENLTSPQKLEYMMLPKLLGLAERAWAPDPAWAKENDANKANAQYLEAWTIFANTLGQRELPRLQHYAGGFNYRVPPVGIQIQGGQATLNTMFPGQIIRYTTDGSEPTLKSPIYKGPFNIQGQVVKASCFRE